MRPYRSLDTAGNVDELALRLNQLRSTSSRKWGTMTPHEMLCHLGDSFEAVLGERTGIFERDMAVANGRGSGDHSHVADVAAGRPDAARK